MVVLSSGDIYRAYRPSRCALRLFLHHQNTPAAEPGPFEEVIRKLGERHEKAHVSSLANVVDLTEGSKADRLRRTKEAVEKKTPIIYQGLFSVSRQLSGKDCEIVGSPDLLILDGSDYFIRDVKIARRVTDADHPEILWQLRLYAWLFRQTFGKSPSRLEVFSGTGETVVIDPLSDGDIESLLAHSVDVISGAEPPFEPIGWTKCGGCGYHEKCWKEANDRHDVGLIVKVDQGLVRALRDMNIVSYDDLLKSLDEKKLSEVQKSWGKKTQRVGKAAADILRSAKALQTNSEIVISKPVIPPSKNYVMFDLEGLPPHLDELEKIYLWGLQVFGEKPSKFTPATAGFGPNGDREGWESFLSNADKIFLDCGDIPFVHWHHYEKTKLKTYMDRYGDPKGIGAKVLANLFDLLPATQTAISLPIPSYSLKVVEKHIGFKRSQTEYGGEWSMAQYIQATEMEDESERQKVLADILKYNEEDLAATWAVLAWLMKY